MSFVELNEGFGGVVHGRRSGGAVKRWSREAVEYWSIGGLETENAIFHEGALSVLSLE